MAARQTATHGGVSAGGSLRRFVCWLALLGAPPEMAGVCSASSAASFASALTACRSACSASLIMPSHCCSVAAACAKGTTCTWTCASCAACAAACAACCACHCTCAACAACATCTCACADDAAPPAGGCGCGCGCGVDGGSIARGDGAPSSRRCSCFGDGLVTAATAVAAVVAAAAAAVAAATAAAAVAAGEAAAVVPPGGGAALPSAGRGLVSSGSGAAPGTPRSSLLWRDVGREGAHEAREGGGHRHLELELAVERVLEHGHGHLLALRGLRHPLEHLVKVNVWVRVKVGVGVWVGVKAAARSSIIGYTSVKRSPVLGSPACAAFSVVTSSGIASPSPLAIQHSARHCVHGLP
eukprot:scaffold60464_cov48-Phaeocystis_antarctica.AAC.1